MSQRKIYIKAPESCTGCRICEIVCSLHHEKVGVNPMRSRIRVKNFPEKGVMIPMVCRFCRNAPCVAACPVEALFQDDETRVITVDANVCDGCAQCVEACEFGGININPEKKIAMICDLCGGEPLCVRYCMNKTLIFCEPQDYRATKGRTPKDNTLPSI